MTQHDLARLALDRRVRRNRIAAMVAAGLVLAALYFWFSAPGYRRQVLRISAGDRLSRRHELAELLRGESVKRQLLLEVVPTSGSQEALRKVDAGDLEAALVQGDLGLEYASVRQVAVVLSEPLHLFVKPEILAAGHTSLRGKRINVSTPGSGTQKMARQTLQFIGLRSGDYVEEHRPYADLIDMADAELPDAIFAVSPLPWNLGTPLVNERGYRLMPLPFGEAMSLRDGALHDMVIPAFSYSVDPAVPPEPLHTVAARLLVVANEKTSDAAVLRLMESIYETDFARIADLPPLDPKRLGEVREYPLHPAAETYLHRNEPLVTGEIIESLENARSFLVSAGIAAFLLWRWYARRRLIGFEKYFDAVSELEEEAVELERLGQLQRDDLNRLRHRLTEIKGEVLERYAEGRLSGDESMASFLAHVTDVRICLDGCVTRSSCRSDTASASASE
jgi:TRAP transporter TAXI family solute receptor